MQIYIKKSEDSTTKSIQEEISDAIGVDVDDYIELDLSGKAVIQVNAPNSELVNNVGRLKKLMIKAFTSFELLDVEIESNPELENAFKQINVETDESDFCAIDLNRNKRITTHKLHSIPDPCVCEDKWNDSEFCGEGDQYGCANCNSDAKGSWCYVSNKECDEDEGNGWAYCDCTHVNRKKVNPGFYSCDCIGKSDPCIANGDCEITDDCPNIDGEKITEVESFEEKTEKSSTNQNLMNYLSIIFVAIFTTFA
jgi:hypothetical protein